MQLTFAIALFFWFLSTMEGVLFATFHFQLLIMHENNNTTNWKPLKHWQGIIVLLTLEKSLLSFHVLTFYTCKRGLLNWFCILVLLFRVPKKPGVLHIFKITKFVVSTGIVVPFLWEIWHFLVHNWRFSTKSWQLWCNGSEM